MSLLVVNLAVKINSPTADLHVRQSVDDTKGGLRLTRANALGTYAQYIDGSAGFNIGYADPANADATPYLTIDGPGGGNVGLGIENPQTRLHVDGDITVENVKGATSLATDADGKIIAGTATGGGGLTEVMPVTCVLMQVQVNRSVLVVKLPSNKQ